MFAPPLKWQRPVSVASCRNDLFGTHELPAKTHLNVRALYTYRWKDGLTDWQWRSDPVLQSSDAGDSKWKNITAMAKISCADGKFKKVK